MKKYLTSIIVTAAVLAALAPLAGYADSTNASAKVTLQSSYLNVLGPVTNSTAGSGPITTDWQTVLQQNIKMANNHDLLITAAFEVGLYTQTTVSSKNMVIDTSTATASVKIRALVDGVEAAHVADRRHEAIGDVGRVVRHADGRRRAERAGVRE